MRDTIRFAACLLPLCLSGAGCMTDIDEPRENDVAGTYILEAGGALQLRIDPQSQTVYTVTAGRLELTSFWRFIVQFQTAESSFGLTGDYARTGTGVILDYDGGGEEAGTLSEDRLIITRSDGVTIVFRKEPEG